MKHLFHRKGKFVDIDHVDCEESFDEIDDQIACEEEKRTVKG